MFAPSRYLEWARPHHGTSRFDLAAIGMPETSLEKIGLVADRTRSSFEKKRESVAEGVVSQAPLGVDWSAPGEGLFGLVTGPRRIAPARPRRSRRQPASAMCWWYRALFSGYPMCSSHGQRPGRYWTRAWSGWAPFWMCA